MRVIVTLIDIGKETKIEGDSSFIGDGADDQLEQKGLGLWLDNWRYAEIGSPNHKSRVFCPWASVLMVETKETNSDIQQNQG